MIDHDVNSISLRLCHKWTRSVAGTNMGYEDVQLLFNALFFNIDESLLQNIKVDASALITILRSQVLVDSGGGEPSGLLGFNSELMHIDISRVFGLRPLRPRPQITILRMFKSQTRSKDMELHLSLFSIFIF